MPPTREFATMFTGFVNKGRAFENYVYLRIKGFEPAYVLENGIEIDFYLTGNANISLLLEIKYNDEMREKQKVLFDSFKAKHKLVVKGYDELEDMHRLIGT